VTAVCPVCGCDQAEGLLCATDTDRLERDLGDVPALVAELDVTISRMDRVPSGGGAPRHADPDEEPGLASIAHTRTPIGWGAVRARDDLTNVLTTWARDVTQWKPHPYTASPVRTAAKLLLTYISEIRRHPAANELVDEITDAIRQARRAVDRPADRVYLGQCFYEENDQTCYEELYANPGASEVRCKVCGITHEVAERRAWLLRRAQDMLFTVEQASQMMGDIGGVKVTQASIRGYVLRKRLAYRPGGKLIRLGDLIDVVMDESERKTA
jgi:hypothetical protein